MSLLHINLYKTKNYEELMKIWEIIGIIVASGALIQFIKWILDSIGINEALGNPLSFFLASLFSLLIIIIIIINQMYNEIKKIKEFLNNQNNKNKKKRI